MTESCSTSARGGGGGGGNPVWVDLGTNLIPRRPSDFYGHTVRLAIARNRGVQLNPTGAAKGRQVAGMVARPIGRARRGDDFARTTGRRTRTRGAGGGAQVLLGPRCRMGDGGRRLVV